MIPVHIDTPCRVCGQPLGFTLRLGEWIAHTKCREAVIARVQEATRIELRAVIAWLESDEPQDGPTAKLYAAQLRDGVHHERLHL